MNRGGAWPIVFSSKRARKNKFNLVSKVLYLTYDDGEKRFQASDKPFNDTFNDLGDTYWLSDLVNRTNEDYTILGPNVLNLGDSGPTRGQYLLLYAEDRDGHLDISFCHNSGNVYAPKGPFKVSFLNFPADDAYPTFYRATSGEGAAASEACFTPNRTDNFDIYRVKFPAGKSLLAVLQTTGPLPVEKVKELSTPADDNCPYILGKRLVFTSNRPGGQGGFDLYLVGLEGLSF